MKPGVHAVVGGRLFDSYLAEEAVASLVGTPGDDALRVLRGEETTWARVVDAARTGSLFAQERALVVRAADAIKGEGEELAEYLESPNPEVTLVLLAAKPDRRRTLWKRILDKATVHNAEPLKGRALRGYVAERLRRRNLQMEEEGLEELLGRFGQDLRRLLGEVDKLEAFAGGRRALTAEDVAAAAGRSLGRPLYLLGDAVSERDAGRTLELVEALLDDGEEALRILGTLHRSLRQVRLTLALQEARVPRAEMASRLLPPNMAFKLPALLAAARRWTEPDLRRAVASLAQADRGMKTGAEPRTALTVAVAAACAPGRSVPSGTPAGR